MTYLRYSPDIEQPDADEQETIDGIAELLVGELLPIGLARRIEL